MTLLNYPYGRNIKDVMFLLQDYESANAATTSEESRRVLSGDLPRAHAPKGFTHHRWSDPDVSSATTSCSMANTFSIRKLVRRLRRTITAVAWRIKGGLPRSFCLVAAVDVLLGAARTFASLREKLRFF